MSRTGILLLLFLVIGQFPIRAALRPSGRAHIAQTGGEELPRIQTVAFRTRGRQSLVSGAFLRGLRIWEAVADGARRAQPHAAARSAPCRLLAWQVLPRRQLSAGRTHSTGEPASFGADFRRSAHV